MTQLTINIENKAILPHLKKILGAIEGVSIAKSHPAQRRSIDRAMDDVVSGRTKKFSNTDEFFADLRI
ncbi:MAG: hypothetical protein K2K68_08485 [Duncaniella sp.]|nr:hypothetical protein [Duncaniella sp.]